MRGVGRSAARVFGRWKPGDSLLNSDPRTPVAAGLDPRIEDTVPRFQAAGLPATVPKLRSRHPARQMILNCLA